eukprot:5085261-Alexandrium_andersonii.AAC.1
MDTHRVGPQTKLAETVALATRASTQAKQVALTTADCTAASVLTDSYTRTTRPGTSPSMLGLL